jgi:23S rRNA (adenine2503-C2)-methyltransferase
VLFPIVLESQHMGALMIYDLAFPEFSSLLAEWGEPAFRVRQIWEGLYRNLWNSPKEFTNLPSNLRMKLEENLGFNILAPVTTLKSSDGETTKILFRLRDGQAVETVLMKYDPKVSGQGRRTLCVSTQVGCAMGCVFCATGQMGFKRHLSSGEIVAQVMYFARLLLYQAEVVTNVVFMGMGEPFHNYENTMAAIDRLNDPEGYNLGARRFTISTVGVIPSILRFASEKRQVNLAISLHAADDVLRTSMLPVNKRYPMDQLLEACSTYIIETGRRITFEWALVNGVNDTPEQAHLLAGKLKGLLCHVNAIPLNPTEGFIGTSTTRLRANVFKDILTNSGIPCSIRIRRGIDIKAGCGQLASSLIV